MPWIDKKNRPSHGDWCKQIILKEHVFSHVNAGSTSVEFIQKRVFNLSDTFWASKFSVTISALLPSYLESHSSRNRKLWTSQDLLLLTLHGFHSYFLSGSIRIAETAFHHWSKFPCMNNNNKNLKNLHFSLLPESHHFTQWPVSLWKGLQYHGSSNDSSGPCHFGENHRDKPSLFPQQAKKLIWWVHKGGPFWYAPMIMLPAPPPLLIVRQMKTVFFRIAFG